MCGGAEGGRPWVAGHERANISGIWFVSHPPCHLPAARLEYHLLFICLSPPPPFLTCVALKLLLLVLASTGGVEDLQGVTPWGLVRVCCSARGRRGEAGHPPAIAGEVGAGRRQVTAPLNATCLPQCQPGECGGPAGRWCNTRLPPDY